MNHDGVIGRGDGLSSAAILLTGLLYSVFLEDTRRKSFLILHSSRQRHPVSDEQSIHCQAVQGYAGTYRIECFL